MEESEREIVALQAINTILAQAAVRNAISVQFINNFYS